MLSTRRISNADDVIDSREIIDRLTELTEQVADEDLPEIDDDEREELRVLTALAEEAADYAPDWQYGETLVRDSYFQEYAQQLAEDVAPSPEAAELLDMWPYRCIDWNQASRELQQDYTSIDFAGVTYWIR